MPKAHQQESLAHKEQSESFQRFYLLMGFFRQKKARLSPFHQEVFRKYRQLPSLTSMELEMLVKLSGCQTVDF